MSRFTGNLQANLAALAEGGAVLPETMFGHLPPAARFDRLSDGETITINTAGGHSLKVSRFDDEEAGPADLPQRLNVEVNHRPLHSRRRAGREKPSTGSSDGLFVFISAGAGFGLYNFMQSGDDTAVVIEPTAELLYILLMNFDFSSFISALRLRFVYETAEDEVYRALKNSGSQNCIFIPHNPSIKALGERLYINSRDRFWSIVEKKSVNMNTLARFQKLWARNIVRNSAGFTRPGHELDRLIERWRGIDRAVLICAGPSLTSYGAVFLRELAGLDSQTRSRTLVIAVDTALHPLAAFGIEADVAFSVDPQPLSRRYLQGRRAAALACDPTTDSYSLQAADAPLYFGGSTFPLYHVLGRQKTRLAFGGSVSTNAFDFAMRCGAAEIIFAGQDLAYVDGMAHCRGARLEEDILRTVGRLKTFENHNYTQLHTIDIKMGAGRTGGRVASNDKLLLFKDWLASHLRRSDPHGRRRVLLAGEQGLAIPGMQSIDYQSAARRLHDSITPLPAEMQNDTDRAADDDREDAFHSAADLLGSLEELADLLDRSNVSGKSTSGGCHRAGQAAAKAGANDGPAEVIEYLQQNDLVNRLVSVVMQDAILGITEGFGRAEEDDRSGEMLTRLSEAVRMNRRLIGRSLLLSHDLQAHLQ